MTTSPLQLALDESEGPYHPQDVISGWVEAPPGVPLSSLIVELGWEMEGEGNPDRDVERTVEIDPAAAAGGFPFRFDCPRELYTYRGDLVRLDWFVRARAEVEGREDLEARQGIVVLPPGRGSLAEPPGGRRQLHRGRPEAVVPLDPGGASGLLGRVAGWFGRGGAARLGEVDFQLAGKEVRPGETVEWVLALQPPGPLEIDGLAARVWGREQVVSGGGHDFATHTSTVVDETVQMAGPSTLTAGGRFERRGRFTVPADAPLSFGFDDNAFEWDVVCTIEHGGRTIWRESRWFRVGVEIEERGD